MSRESAKAKYTRLAGDPEVGYISPDDVMDAIDIMYDDLVEEPVDTFEIADGAVTAAKIADDTITATQIAANAVGASELADNAVDTNAIANSAVTSAKIADGNVGPTAFALTAKPGNWMTANQASVETNTDGWQAVESDLSASADWAAHGTKSLKVVTTSATGRTATTLIPVPTNAGEATVNLVVNSPREVVWRGLKVQWFDVNTALVQTDYCHTPVAVDGDVRHYQFTCTIPAAVTQAMIWYADADDTGQVSYIDCAGVWAGRGGDWRMPGVPIPQVDMAVASQVATVAARQRPNQGGVLDVDKITFFGHSYVDATPSFVTTLVDRFGMGTDDYSVAGSGMTGEYHWVPFLRTWIPGGTGFEVEQGVRVMMHGLNDVWATQSGILQEYAVPHSFDFWVSRMRAAGAIYENDSPYFKDESLYDWGTLDSTTVNSGDNFKWTTNSVNGLAYYTIVMPEGFPGGTIAIHLLSQSPGAAVPASAGPGGTHTAFVNGVEVASIIARSTAAGTQNNHVLRVPNLPAGQAEVTVQVRDVTGLTAVDCFWWEAPADEGPLVVLVAQPYLTATGYAAFTTGGETKGDTEVDQLNAIMRALPAKFGPRVIVADAHLPIMNADADYFKVDEVHPNGAGAILIANAIGDAISNAGFQLGPSRAGNTGYRVRDVTGTKYGDMWDGTQWLTLGEATVIT